MQTLLWPSDRPNDSKRTLFRELGTSTVRFTVHGKMLTMSNETVAAQFGGKWELRPKFVERNVLLLVRRLLETKRGKTILLYIFYWLLATSYFYSTIFNGIFGQVRTLPTRKCCVPAKYYPHSADVLRSTQTSGRFFQYDSYSRCISHSALNQGLEAASSVYR